MKRLICALLSPFLITPCLGSVNIHIKSEAVETVIKQKISGADAQIAALAEYNAQIKNAGGKNAGVPAQGIWSVCTAAGWDITKADGKSKCRDFSSTLMRYATWNFRAVCDKDRVMIERGTGRCIDNVFSNKILGGVTVNMLIASGLAKEYTKVKYGDNNLICSKNFRQTTFPPDDYVQCVSMDTNMAYEFKFNSVTSNTDALIAEGTEAGVCKIFGLEYSASGYQQASYLGNGQKVSESQSWPAACETTDATICAKVNESMTRFGRSARIGITGSNVNQRSACVITTNDITSASELRTAFGIDNQAFKKSGIQLNATTSVKDQVCDYVRKTVKSPTITSCVCNDGITHLYDFSSLITESDDILTCNINGKPVDFLFDDLSESMQTIADGGSQGMDCMAAGGTYSGQRCINLDKDQCELLASANIANCPACKRVKYQDGICSLPSSADAEQMQKDINIAMIIGGAIVGVGVTVITGGAGSVVVVTGIETLGSLIELGAQVKIDAIADEFLVKSNRCRSASCAQDLIKDNFQHLAASQNDFSAPEISAIDAEIARLASLIPDDSDFWADIAINSLSLADNQPDIFKTWTPEQVWRAVGITLQLASVIVSVVDWFGTKTKTVVTKLSKSTNVLQRKTEKVVDLVESVSDQRVLTAKQLQLKQKLKIIDPSALKGDDIELYTLWKKYAPRNQTFDDFKEMGSLQELRKWAKNWIAWDDIEKFNVIDAKIDKFYTTHPDALTEVAQGLDRSVLQSKYPELYGLFDQLDELGDSEKLRQLRAGRKGGNYSTTNLAMHQDYNVAIRPQQNAIYKKYNTAYQRGDLKLDDAQTLLNQAQDDLNIKFFGYQIATGTTDEVAALRVEQVDRIMNESPRLQDLRARWSTLSKQEKLDFAQEMSDQILIRNGVATQDLPKVNDVRQKPGTRGAFTWSTKPTDDGFRVVTESRVDIDLDQLDSFPDFINTLSHEVGGHGVDALNPDAGALGSDIMNKTSRLHGSDSYDTYRAGAREVSAWRIGEVVEDAFRSQNPIDINNFLAKPLMNKGAHIIDATTYKTVSYEATAEGLRKLIPDVYSGKAALVFDYSDDILENLKDITNMLENQGLKIFRTDAGHYTIGTEQVINSMK